MKKSYWCFIIVFVLVVVMTALYASTRTDIYKSEALIGMDDASPVDGILQDIQEQLANHIFLERLIESNQLYGYGRRNDFVMVQAVKSVRRQIGIARESAHTVAIAFLSPDPQSAQAVTEH